MAKKSAKTIKTFVKDMFYRAVTLEQVKRARIKVRKMQREHVKNHQLLESMAMHHSERVAKSEQLQERQKDAAVQTEPEDQDRSSLAPIGALCIICYSRPPAVLFRPCLHHVVCYECWSSCYEKDKCVKCREKLAFLGTMMTHGP